MSERKSGILLHISSLPCEFGIGDLGPCAYQFADFLQQTKQHFWQILPINPTDPISEYSPYSSLSAFAGNTLLISPRLLVDNGMLKKGDIVQAPSFPSETVDYDSVAAYKMELCHRAYDCFLHDLSIHRLHEKEFNNFITENAIWLDDYALFVTIKDHLNGAIWTSWPEPLQKRVSGALQDFAQEHSNELNKVKFLQYLFFKQWGQLKTYCKKKDVRLIGDIPIYMNFDSVDVWTYPQNYKLDDQFCPTMVAGVPPDYFSDKGQRWGNPVYNWGTLKSSQFSWWVERFRLNFQLFDMVRIDHFRGLVQYWEIPVQEKTALNGNWVDVPTEEFFKTLEQNFSAPLPIIAEDLGYITDDVREAMKKFGFPGMKVLLFAFNDNMKTHPYLPHNYKKHCVVYTGTHDNNTVLGWFQSEATQKEIRNLSKYIGKKVSAESVHWDFIRMACDSLAELAIIPMQDILGLGAEARMNRPATTDGNWRWRVSPEVFNDELIRRLSNLTSDTNRD